MTAPPAPPLRPRAARAARRRSRSVPPQRAREIRSLANVLLQARSGGGGRRSCPHCENARIIRWGGFSGRRRFRCRACLRTFSDFTGTPAYRSRYPERWRPFARSMVVRLSVRAAGRELRIHKDTAWRWRHALLIELLAADRELLEGTVDVGGALFPYAAKGVRQPWRRPYRTSDRPPDRPRVRVLFARDQSPRTLARMLPWAVMGRPTMEELQLHLLQRLRSPAVLRTPWGRFGPAARLCSKLEAEGAPDRVVRHLYCPGARLFNAYRLAVVEWLRPFHGISTCYLERYLQWFRIADPDEADGPPRRLLLRLAGC